MSSEASLEQDQRSMSIVEVGALRPPGERYDVAILGGGLAGLTLAIQLKQARPQTSVVVLEKREGPAPLAAFKVGESTVPAGAHYFAEVVGMRDHLANEQLVKLGLRFFFLQDGNVDITKRPEKGPADFPEKDTYQVDRGLFENKLAARARALGVDVAQGARIGSVTLADESHTVAFEQFGREGTTCARWVVDASGRSSLLKRQLALGRDCAHHINAAWFRLSGGLDLEEWGAHDEAWLERMSRPGIRKYSTNHLLGEGYWIWLIPLATGPISIGVCADPRFHPFEQINSFERLLAWLRDHEPQLASSVENRVEDVEDFLRIEDYAYGVEQTYSTERWSLVGEAAAFADPFFSPGSDFIAFGNTFTTDLVVRDLDGEDIAERVDYYNDLYQRLFANVIARYRDTYTVFGNSGVAVEMLYWDTVSSHSGITLVCVANKLTDLEFMKSIDADLDRHFELNVKVHDMCRQWNEIARPEAPLVGPPGVELPAGPLNLGPGFGPAGFGPVGMGSTAGPPAGALGDGPPPGGPPDGFQLPIILRMVRMVFDALARDFPDEAALRTELHAQLRGSEELAVEIFRRAASGLPEPPLADTPINPYALGLDPTKWEADGLYADVST